MNMRHLLIEFRFALGVQHADHRGLRIGQAIVQVLDNARQTGDRRIRSLAGGALRLGL